MVQRLTDAELFTWRPAKNVGSAVIGARHVCRVCTGGDGLDRSIVAVTQPDSTAGLVYAVNGPTPIPVGGFGRVCFGPVVLVAYETGTPAVDEQWGWVEDQGTIEKDSNPIVNVLRVVNSTTKLLLGLVISGGDLVKWGKLDDALAYNGTQTVSIWSDDWSEDTGEDIEGVKAPPTMTTGSIASGSWVRIRRRPDGVWYADMAPC
ncbi:MAG: hypothetical protein WC378_00315 [Opitutaceae bacterium]|jgi:hypothetical protein